MYNIYIKSQIYKIFLRNILYIKYIFMYIIFYIFELSNAYIKQTNWPSMGTYQIQ